MPEETKTQQEVVENVPAIPITNEENGAVLNITKMKVKKGKGVGREYFGLHPKETYDNLIKFFGSEKLFTSWLRPNFNRFCLMLSKEVTKEEKSGEDVIYNINQEGFVESLVKLSPLGQSMSALKALLFELVDRLPEIDDPAEMSEVIAQIKDIRSAMEAKKVKTDEPDEGEGEDSGNQNRKVA